eukprot:2085217-Prymnesium_polylepis.1
MCNPGILQGSALCSSCQPGMGKRFASGANVCLPCEYPPWVYWVNGLLYVVLWFPLLREITTKYIRSLYITIGFLQFLGIFSQFNIDWSRADCDLGYLLRWMPFFSLNIADTIHFSCAGSGSAFGYRAQWIVQMLLPMCYPAYCVASIASEICIGALARRHLPPTQVLLQVGWRPRRDFSVKALLN